MMSEEENIFLRWFFYLVLAGAVAVWIPNFFVERFWSDEALYAWSAKRIFAHPLLLFSPEISQPHPPLFPVILAGAHFFFKPLLACRVVLFIFYLAGIMATYALARRVGSEFVAVLSAGLLSVNYIYFYMSRVILLDIPTAVFWTVLALILLSLKKSSSYLSHAAVGAWVALILLLKWHNVIIVPVVFLFYMFALSDTPFKRRAGSFAVAMCLFVPVALFLYWLGLRSTGALIPHQGDVNLLRLWNWDLLHKSLMVMMDAVYPWEWLILFFAVGIYALARQEKYRELTLFVSWITVFVLSIQTINIPLDLRYLLTITPAVLIISAVGVEYAVFWYNERPWARVNISQLTILMLILTACLVKEKDHLGYLLLSDHRYTGYAEAGDSVKELVHPDTVILAGSERQMRYVTDINYKAFGGQMIPFRQGKEDFERFLNSTDAPIVLVIDAWENLQPGWAREMTPQTLEYLSAKGFSLKHVVWRGVLKKDEMQQVAWVLARDGQGKP